MTAFEMIKYHGREYPADVPLRIEEIAAHFDTSYDAEEGRFLLLTQNDVETVALMSS